MYIIYASHSFWYDIKIASEIKFRIFVVNDYINILTYTVVKQKNYNEFNFSNRVRCTEQYKDYKISAQTPCELQGVDWFGLVLWHINHFRLFNAKSSSYINIKYIWFVNLFFCTQLNRSKYCYVSLTIQLNNFFVYTQLNDQTVLFLTIRYGIHHVFAVGLNVKQFYLTHRLDPTRCCHSGSEWTMEEWPWRAYPIFQSSSITEGSSSDCWVSYLGYSYWVSYPSAEIQSVYSAAPADWAKKR